MEIGCNYMRVGYMEIMLRNCEPDPKELEQELEQELDNFPHPRNQPMEAVIALHKVRELRDRIAECHTNQADHAANQDAPK